MQIGSCLDHLRRFQVCGGAERATLQSSRLPGSANDGPDIDHVVTFGLYLLRGFACRETQRKVSVRSLTQRAKREFEVAVAEQIADR